MAINKRAAILLIASFLVSAPIPMLGWAADNSPAPAPVSPASGATDPNNSLLGILNPLLTASVGHSAPKDCKPDMLYSQHDVVGDPDACFRGHYDVRGGNFSSGAPAL